MGTINSNQFSAAVTSGLSNFYQIWYGLETAVDESPGSKNTASTEGSNPRESGNNFSQSGSQLEGSSLIWTSDQDQDLQQLRVETQLTSQSGRSDFAIWNEGGTGFNQQVDIGTQITVSDYAIECQRAGIAEALISGNQNLTDEVHLLDGNQSRIDEPWSSKAAPQTFQATDGAFAYQADVSFENTSGGSRTVGGVEVVYQGSDNDIIRDTSISKTLNDGDTLIFTTLEVQLTLP